jgi:hypothetical protein
MLQTMQQTGGALGVAALTSIAVSHGRSDALLTGSGIILVALVIAALAIKPARHVAPPTAEEYAREMESLPLFE